MAGSSSDGTLGERNDKITRIFPTFFKNIAKTKQQQFIMILKIKPFHLEIIFMSKILPD